jgi:DNA-binding XRE family transcriptional regulator
MEAHELLNLLASERAYRETLQQIQAQGAELFKAIRAEHSLTQRQLADILSVDFSFISKVENGHLRPGKPVLTRLAKWIESRTPDQG